MTLRPLQATLCASALAFSFIAEADAQSRRRGKEEAPAPAAAEKPPEKAPGEKVVVQLDPYPSTYKAGQGADLFITNATILDGVGGKIERGALLLRNGKVAAIGADLTAPAGVTVLDAGGRWVTPGIIDIHSHLGDYPSPGVNAHSDGNEATEPNTAEVWAEHSVWPQDPGFNRARAGGVTTLHVLPGSANLFGGRGVTLKNVSAGTVQDMKFPGAPYTLKMACGENPKRVYGGRSRSPATRMGNMAGYRQAWARAAENNVAWDKYAKEFDKKGGDATPPRRDLELETLGGVLRGEILVQMHCYRGDEMAQILDMAREFNYKVTTFHHAVESYKVAPLLAKEGVCSAMWADWWGFKLESYDGIRENIPFVHAAGACAMIHSDSATGIQRLNQEIAKALADGRRAGLDITEAQAWAWVSSNPAKALGIGEKTGSLAPGKAADVVIWSASPFSTYAKADLVLVDGARVYDRADPATHARSDFELGQPGEGEVK